MYSKKNTYKLFFNNNCRIFVMAQYFSVKCKRCGSVLETAIMPHLKQEVESLSRNPTIQCPRCKFTVAYEETEFFLGNSRWLASDRVHRCCGRRYWQSKLNVKLLNDIWSLAWLDSYSTFRIHAFRLQIVGWFVGKLCWMRQQVCFIYFEMSQVRTPKVPTIYSK